MPWDGTKNSAKEMAGQHLQRDTVLTSPCDCFHVANSAKTTARLAYGWCSFIIDLYDLSTLGNNICLFRSLHRARAPLGTRRSTLTSASTLKPLRGHTLANIKVQ